MLEVVVGCMFSGKSEELTRRLRREKIAGLNVVAFKPAIDNRYDSEKIASHSSMTFEAKTFKSFKDLIEKIMKIRSDDGDRFPDVIGIDEVQFLPKDVVPFIEMIVNSGSKVIVAGLDMDYLGKPFGPIPELMAIGDKVIKLSAICVAEDERGKICGEPATRSYRLAAKDTGSIVQVGAADSYQARCRKCWNK
jgi:thymidine kinase